jgi:hypothetical protein
MPTDDLQDQICIGSSGKLQAMLAAGNFKFEKPFPNFKKLVFKTSHHTHHLYIKLFRAAHHGSI